MAGNIWPGSTPGAVGPRPVINNDKISPGAAGFEALTRLKSAECVTAGPWGVGAIWGVNAGTNVKTHCSFPPPLMRRLPGSSVTDAARAAIVWVPRPICPRTPKKAPVPPTIAQSPFFTRPGEPGVVPPLRPNATMVPTGVPSVFKISKICSRIDGCVVSAIAPPMVGSGVGLVMIDDTRDAYSPFTGSPLTATMSPRGVAGVKFLIGAAGTMLGLVAYLEMSEMSPWYSTTFSVSMLSMTGDCPFAILQNAPAARAAQAIVFRFHVSPIN